ncbi:MAG: C40 family peptidase [Lachnospiraceae bacterium]|nr:C40 family peptidase [Lachnospiraceae bacterium]
MRVKGVCGALALIMALSMPVSTNASNVKGASISEIITNPNTTVETTQVTDLSNLKVDKKSITYYNNTNAVVYADDDAGKAVFTFSGVEDIFDDVNVDVDVSYTGGNSVKLEYDGTGNALTFSTQSKYYGKNAGKQKIQVKFTNSDNETKTFSLKVFAYNLRQRTDSNVLLAKDKTKTVKLERQKSTNGSWRGIKAEKVTWKTSNKNVAKISNKGKITAKKKSKTCYVTGEYENYTYYWSVNVTTADKVKVIKTAKNIYATSKYSQPLRMRQGYYDCSSLVWRSYRLIGKYLGTSSRATYAPTAAGIAQYLEGKGKTISGGISKSNTDNGKLIAGDLLFEGGASNGRYRGVYHVEMFTGYDISYIKSNGKPVYMNSWASKPDGRYGYGTSNDFVCRP